MCANQRILRFYQFLLEKTLSKAILAYYDDLSLRIEYGKGLGNAHISVHACTHSCAPGHKVIDDEGDLFVRKVVRCITPLLKRRVGVCREFTMD